MSSFKTFLAEIDLDDSVYSKAASAEVANIKLDSTWAPLPIKGPFWKKGYTIHWKENPFKVGYRLAVAYAGQVVVYIELDNYTVKVPGGTLVGLEVDSLSSRPAVRGTGLVLRTYEALVESGQVLFSSNSQTSGSQALWSRLIKSPHVVPFVLAREASARFYIRKYDGPQEPNVLLTGTNELKLHHAAYESADTRWVALPKDLPGLDKLRDGAIDLG